MMKKRVVIRVKNQPKKKRITPKKKSNPVLFGIILFLFICIGIFRSRDDGGGSKTPTPNQVSIGATVVHNTNTPKPTDKPTRTPRFTVTRIVTVTRASILFTPIPTRTRNVVVPVATQQVSTSTRSVVVPAPTQQASTNKNCSPAYPGVCIPPPPPDLDCPDIPYKRFTVLSPDPHNFDRDGDGIGCET
jgi:hypothetical protein